ncbi:MAG: hypothetical protein IKV63_02410, partial [Clostridia bacterium]|nr:hypothetical protein [Clostridia bacterium]
TATAVENAFLILVAKNAETGLIEKIWVNNAFALATENSTTQEFALANGQVFDYFLLNSKLAPIIKTK